MDSGRKLRGFFCSCSFPLSVHHLIGDWKRTSWRTGSLWAAVAWTSGLQLFIGSSLSPASSPSSSSKRENLSVHVHISAPEMEHVRACAWLNGIAPPLHAGVQLWDYFNSENSWGARRPPTAASPAVTADYAASTSENTRTRAHLYRR